MKYIYPKNMNISDINILELEDKYIIKHISSIYIYGIILEIKNIKIIKEYNKFKLVISDKNELSNFIKYDNYLNNNIENYKKIINNNIILLPLSNKIEKYYKENKNELVLIIHYVKKSGFLNIPKISIL